ncbi:MAG: molybdopterin-dependent oxidoreductase [Deltaproteobacteria bacterium]|nr:molybdopterin-dependent oxidoreductase [Deltaproteobacteria bacterium]
MSELSIVGKRIPKIDAREKVTGRAVYAADIRMPGMLYGKVVRCWNYAHATVTKLDLSEAAKVPGVIKVLGPQDVTSNTYNSGVLDLMVSDEMRKMLGDIEDQPIFTDHVKHQADGICGIIAETEEAAERAAEKIIVEYEPLPVYLTAEESMKPDAVQFTPLKPGNKAFELPEPAFPGNAYGWGDVDEAMKKADVVVEDAFYVPKQKQCQMEPHAYVALYDDRGRLNCWTSTQMPKLVQTKLARLFELPMSRVKVNQTTVGGGFGARLGMVAEPQACAMAMAVPGKPVMIQYLREEDWVASESRHPGMYWMKMGFKKDGMPVAVDAHFTSYKGGYYTQGSGVAFTTGAWLAGMYKYGALRYRGDSYYTNQVPCGAYRGYGNPQTNFPLEQLIDRACNELGIDPVDWRIKWHKDVGDDGWCIGFKYPSCALTECLERGAQAIGWKEKRAKYSTQTGSKRRGIGVACMNHTSGAMPMLLEHTVVSVRLNEDASAEVILSCSDLGCGAHTALTQIAAETLGFPLEDVHLLTGNSDASGFDIGAHASRTTYVGGGAVKQACEDVKRQLFERASKHLGTPADQLEMKDKRIFIKNDPQQSVDIKTITTLGVINLPDPATGQPVGEPGQILGYASYFPPHNSPPFSACFVELEVDTETGEVKLLECLTAYDIGRAIHPPSVEGQLDGGVHHGLGNVLTEETYYDKKGLCLNSNFTDYKLLGPSDMPKLTNILVEQPDPYGPYGAKSCGEEGIVPPIGAAANAVYNAIGVQIKEAPITPEKILKAIKK